MDGSYPVKLFRHGEGHAVDIPAGFNLPGEDAVIRQEGDRLIIEPAQPKRNLLDLLAEWAAELPLEDHERMEPVPRAMPRPFDLWACIFSIQMRCQRSSVILWDPSPNA